jgi:hypothetical protein
MKKHPENFEMEDFDVWEVVGKCPNCKTDVTWRDITFSLCLCCYTRIKLPSEE